MKITQAMIGRESGRKMNPDYEPMATGSDFVKKIVANIERRMKSFGDPYEKAKSLSLLGFNYDDELSAKIDKQFSKMNESQLKRVKQAIKETEAALARAIRFSPENQDKNLIAFYKKHIEKLSDSLISGDFPMDERFLKRKTNPMKAFSAAQIARLKSEYSKINRINPDSEQYEKLIVLLDGLDLASLKNLADADIKFVSGLARNRVLRRTNERKTNPTGAAKVVFNRLLGGWFIVRGPHQTPIGGRFDSKAEALAHLNRNKNPLQSTVSKNEKKANFPYCVESKPTENWSVNACFKTLEPAKEYARALSQKYPKLTIRVMHYAGGAM